MTLTPPRRAARRDRGRAATRSALLSVALPSVGALGVFAAAAALTSAHPPHRSAPPPRPGPDTPGEARAARTGARDPLPEPPQAPAPPPEPTPRQTAAAPPGYALPVEAPGLSAAYGSAGTHWAARHTGIDFPVAKGTPVRAVTDGTVSARWNPAYGYMAAVTAPDGTRTWYCHLGTYRLRRGQVRAGEVIAYSGSSGNSTGPHLHFEVHPDHGGPVDPLPWLLAHGLDPR
ncbi:M23 family metallopeptidase [Kitasatospora sp. MMS16-BH015]|uniref:M23 family metallopeptidase n=1 Tax=Kitasatospora sp. MMS16-BH015 TaxID=2018025 RepID=UPI0020C4DC60|nr:M23 family metallopeptidase [Kitasatospora sp. MMS16-BH015]